MLLADLEANGGEEEKRKNEQKYITSEVANRTDYSRECK
jgi:hypothetical protein